MSLGGHHGGRGSRFGATRRTGPNHSDRTCFNACRLLFCKRGAEPLPGSLRLCEHTGRGWPCPQTTAARRRRAPPGGGLLRRPGDAPLPPRCGLRCRGPPPAAPRRAHACRAVRRVSPRPCRAAGRWAGARRARRCEPPRVVPVCAGGRVTPRRSAALISGVALRRRHRAQPYRPHRRSRDPAASHRPEPRVRRPHGALRQLHAEAVARAQQHPGPDRHQPAHHGGTRRAGRRSARHRPRHRHRRAARHA